MTSGSWTAGPVTAFPTTSGCEAPGTLTAGILASGIVTAGIVTAGIVTLPKQPAGAGACVAHCSGTRWAGMWTPGIVKPGTFVPPST